MQIEVIFSLRLVADFILAKEGSTFIYPRPTGSFLAVEACVTFNVGCASPAFFGSLANVFFTIHTEALVARAA